MKKQEKEAEARLVERSKEFKCLCLKFVSPGFRGVPDRMILVPGGHVIFVEMKKEGEKSKALQLHVQARLRRLGFPVFTDVATYEDIEKVMQVCRRLQYVQ